MHPSSLLSYYPTYAILDEIVAKNDYKTLNIYIDLKNNLQSTYMEHAIVNLVNASKGSKFLDSSIFSSLISFLSFHKMWSVKRGINLNFYIFFETGKSFYHKNISKKYKISRQIDDLYGLDRADRELFFKVLHANFQLIEKACNLIPRIKVIRMHNLEADFVPYYLITRNLVSKDEESAHIVYSNDHDLWQCVSDHCYVFSKSGKRKKIIQKNEVMKNFLKRENDIPDCYLPLSMSIVGDVGDDVDGVKDVGPARFIEIFEELINLTGNMNEIYDKVQNKKKLISSTPPKIGNKYLKKVVDEELSQQRITKSLRLVSFELLSRELDDPNSTEILDKLKTLIKIIEDDKVVPKDNLNEALEKNGVILENTSLDFLYI
ncbi:MAG: hypothetical protein PVG65_01935 [Candidatus Thorarchaeota archaeon]|jgi:hypothetical protein